MSEADIYVASGMSALSKRLDELAKKGWRIVNVIYMGGDLFYVIVQRDPVKET